MKNKKILMAVVASSMLLSAVASGCASTQNSSTKDSSKAGSSTADASGKIGGVMYPEGLPIVDKGTYTFSLFVDDSNENGQWAMMPILEEQTGIKVDVQYSAYEIAKEKYGLALSSGDYADSIGGWCISDTDVLTYGMNMGVFIPLEDYIEKYCPNITALLNMEGVRETMTAPDGHIYSIPYVMEAPQVDFNPYINTRWLKNVGMEIPTTTQELHDVLVAFKEKDANGNGDPTDEIPFAFDPDNRHLGYLCGYFGVSTDIYGFTMENGELTFGANRDEYKKGIQWLSNLYAEGLLDQEMFTQDKSQWKAKGGQDLYGVSMMYASPDIMPYDAGEEPEWVPLPVLTGEDGKKPVWLKSTYGTQVLKNQVVITDNAKNPEAILRWWDNVLALENSLQTQKGPINVTLFKEGESYRVIDTATLPEADQKKYNWNNLWPQSLPKYIPLGFRFVEDNPIFEEKPVVDKQYAPYLTKETIPSYWASAEDASKLSDLQTSLKDYIDQKTAEWVAGQANIDKEWDSYKDQLDKLNLEKYIEIRKAALNKK